MTGLTIINANDAEPLAFMLGLPTTSLDALDGKTDGMVKLDVIQNKFRDRLIMSELPIEDYGYGDADSYDVAGYKRKPEKVERHLVCFIDNGDGYISDGDLVLHIRPNGTAHYSIFSSDTYYNPIQDEVAETIKWDEARNIGGKYIWGYAQTEIEPILRRVRKALIDYNSSSWFSRLFGFADGTNSFEGLKTYFSVIRCEMRTLSIPGSSLHRACFL